jgi:hypothetical protein
MMARGTIAASACFTAILTKVALDAFFNQTQAFIRQKFH